jgi:hypothetical protein
MTRSWPVVPPRWGVQAITTDRPALHHELAAMRLAADATELRPVHGAARSTARMRG